MTTQLETFWHLGTGQFIPVVDTVTAHDARALAIRYHAYHQAINAEDWNGVIVWGEMLIEVLDETGIDLADVGNVKNMVAIARVKYARAKAEKEIK